MITSDLFAQSLKPLFPASKIAIAVSGGADSLCLTLLLDEFCKQHHHELIALTCDHGLRPESYDEALWVQHFCKLRDIKHYILRLEGPKPQTGIQEWARKERYKAFAHFCLNHDIQDLFLAHHLDDQIETFLMRLLAQSTSYGLASMSPINRDYLVCLKRPLLNFFKTDLIKTFERFNVHTWIEDPSNLNSRYHRIHLRKEIIPFLPKELSTAYLQKTIQDLRFYRDALEKDVQNLVNQYVVYNPIGFAEINKDVLKNDAVFLLRFFKKCLQDIGGKRAFTKQETFHSFIHKLKAGIVSITLANCLFVQKKDKIFVFREIRHLPPPISIQKQGTLFWDNRFVISYDIKNGQCYKIESAGEDLISFGKKVNKPKEKRAFLTYPCLKGVDGFIHAPHLCYDMNDVFFKVDFLPIRRKNQFDEHKK